VQLLLKIASSPTLHRLCTDFGTEEERRKNEGEAWALPCCKMETTLLFLVFDVATTLLTHIPKNLAENPFQSVVSNLATLRSFWILNGLVSVIANIHGSAIEMA
jgi:hypothetical protein